MTSTNALTYPRFHTVDLDNASINISITSSRHQYPETIVLQTLENRRNEGRNSCGLQSAFDDGADYITQGPNVRSANRFDAKKRCRAWTAGGHRIDAANSPAETRHDLTLLLGRDPTEFDAQRSIKWDGTVVPLPQNLVGAKGWESLGQLFTVLNNTVNYVVLRNFECLPETHHLGSHNDIDLLTDNYHEACLVANARSVYRSKYRVHNTVSVAGKDVSFDFRYIGDGYYDQRWELSILTQRILSAHGVYVPDPINHFYSLLYHAAVHKPHIEADYVTRLATLAASLGIDDLTETTLRSEKVVCGILQDYLDQHQYFFTEPTDLSVFLNLNIFPRRQLSLRRRVLARLHGVLRPLRARFKNALRNASSRAHDS